MGKMQTVMKVVEEMKSMMVVTGMQTKVTGMQTKVVEWGMNNHHHHRLVARLLHARSLTRAGVKTSTCQTF